MKKIAIDKGHNRGADQGAVGIGKENVMNIEVGDRVISKLKALGYDVLDVISQIPNNVSLGQSLGMRADIANRWGADQYVSIHHNCGGGHGVEVWIGSDSSRDKAQSIVNNIATLGFTNRGIKVQGIDGGHLYVLNNTSMPALLTEGCFVDSQDDINRYNAENMANAIVKGLIGITTTVVASQPAAAPQPLPLTTVAKTTGDNTTLIIQEQLNTLLKCNLVLDGIPGPKTDEQIRRFQGLMGLAADGIWGPKTAGAVGEIYSRPVDGVPYKHYEYATRYIQMRVGAGVDGVFGNGTKVAVQNWQAGHGLTADGVVGPATWSKLLDENV